MKWTLIRSFFWSVFSCIPNKYRKIGTRKYDLFGHFSHSDNSMDILKKLIHRIKIRSRFPEKAKSVARRCSLKSVFLKISRNSQKSISTGVTFLMKLQASGLQLKIQTNCHRRFPVNIMKFLRTHEIQLRAAASKSSIAKPSRHDISSHSKINFEDHLR